MANITQDEVQRIAALAYLDLSSAEVEQMATELEQIVDFFSQLQSVDTSGVEPTDQVTGLVDVFRPDEVKPGLSREALLANAPDQQNGFFKVKRVLDND